MPHKTKKDKLIKVMRENPLMPIKEAQDKYYEKFREHVSSTLVDVVRKELTGRKPKTTTKQLRAIQFIRDNPMLSVSETLRAYEEQYNETISRSFYHDCKNKLREKEPMPTIETIIKRVKVPKVIEGVKLHKLIVGVGGLKEFDTLLSSLEEFGSLKRIRNVLESIRPALEEQTTQANPPHKEGEQ